MIAVSDTHDCVSPQWGMRLLRFKLMAIGLPLMSHIRAKRMINPMGIIMPAIAQKLANAEEARKPDNPSKVSDQNTTRMTPIK